MDTVNRKIPVMFQKLKSYDATEDERFLQVKIWLMHTGTNFNNSNFSKDVIEEAIPTLANTPIVGYLEESDGNLDFSDHREVLVKEDGKYKTKYKGQAFGVIPESNNAKFETRVCDDGVEREFLTVEGVLWTKWDDPIAILEESGMKGQSMELADTIEGEWVNKVFNFKKFTFFGACILGDSVMPAMHNASIELNFSVQDMHNFIQKKMEDYKNVCQQHQFSVGDVNTKKEGEQMFANVLAKFNVTEVELAEKGINLADFATETDLESKLDQIFGDVNNTGVSNASTDNVLDSNGLTDTPNLDSDVTGYSANNTEPAKTEPIPTPTNFSLSGGQLIQELQRELSEFKEEDRWGYQSQCFYYTDYLPDENIVIVYDWDDNWYLGLTYTINGNDVEIDYNSGVRYIAQWVKFTPVVKDPELDGVEVPDEDDNDDAPNKMSFVPKSYHKYVVSAEKKNVEKQFAESEVAKVRSELQEVTTKYQVAENELKQVKLSEHSEKAESLFRKFSNSLNDEDIKDLRESVHEFSVEQLEEKLLARFAKKNLQNYTAPKEEEKPLVKFSLPPQPSNSAVDSPYSHILKKFIP